MFATAPAAATATAPAQQTAAAAGPREITITGWDLGRLGNHLASLRTAAEAATLLGCDLHVPVVPGALRNHDHRVLTYKGQLRIFKGPNRLPFIIFKAPNGSRCEYRPEIARLYRSDSRTWFMFQLRPQKLGPVYAAFRFESEHVRGTRVTDILNDFLGHNETHAAGLRCSKYRFDVAMHIRAGDIMRGSYTKNGGWQPSRLVHPMYGQPPLSSYVDCLEHNLRPGQRAVAVMEDLSNPVAPVLQMMAEHQTVWNLTVVQLPVLNEAVATLGCAPIVCNARGSFHGSYVNTFHTRKSVDASDEKIRGAYGKIWKNTAKQRAAMLHSRRR